MIFGLIKPNDWIVVYKNGGGYTTAETRKYNAPSKKWYCYLNYSKSRNKYKISHSLDYNYDWINASNPYQACMDRMIKLQRKNN